MPLFYAILIFNIVVDAATGVWVSRSEVIINLFFLFPFFPGKHESLVWAGWSLGVECAFYVIFPAVALLARSLRTSIILLVALALVNLAVPVIVRNSGLTTTYASMSFPSNLLYFQAGVATYALVKALAGTPIFEKMKISWQPWRTAWLFTSVLTILVLHDLGVPTFAVLTLACCAWIVCAYCGLPSWLDNPTFRLFGRLSYGIYLIHPLVLYYATKQGVYSQIGQIVQSPVGTFIVSAMVTLPIVITLAYLGYRVIEAPGIAAGEKLLAAIPKANALDS